MGDLMTAKLLPTDRVNYRELTMAEAMMLEVCKTAAETGQVLLAIQHLNILHKRYHDMKRAEWRAQMRLSNGGR